MLINIHGEPTGVLGCYSPGERISAESSWVEGCPDPAHISTSRAERSNLAMWMRTRRFTQSANAVSMKAENHAYVIVLHCTAYNFVCIHGILRSSPAMASGTTTKLWEIPTS